MTERVTVASMYLDGNTCSRRISPPYNGVFRRGPAYCNGPQLLGGSGPQRVACMHHVRRKVWIWVDVCFSFPAPEGICLSHCSLHLPTLPSQLLSVLLCTLPLGLTDMPNRTKATQSDRDMPSAFPPILRQTGVPQHACR